MPSEPQAESAIEIRVDDIAQLFDTLDPFPFRERDLDKDAEEFIVGWGQEFPRHSALKVIIHVPQSELASEPAKHAESALQHYFGYRANVLGRAYARAPARDDCLLPIHVQPHPATRHRPRQAQE